MPPALPLPALSWPPGGLPAPDGAVRGRDHLAVAEAAPGAAPGPCGRRSRAACTSSLPRLAAAGLMDVGAARFGRRKPGPHARPAAPLPVTHGASGHEAAMADGDSLDLPPGMPLYRAVRLFPLAQRAPGEHEAAPFRAAEERRLKLRGAELARYQTRTFTVPPNIRDRRTRDGMQEAAANIHLITQGWVVRCAEENLAATMGAVCGGDFIAWGRPSPEGPWVPIPPDELAGLKAVKDAFGSESAGPDVRNPGRAFFDVRVAPRRGVPLEPAWRFFGPAELVDDIEAKELRHATDTAFYVVRAAGEHVSLWLQDAAAAIASREARFDEPRIAPWVPASGSEVSAAIGDAIRWLTGELESGRLVADAWETKTGLSDGRASIPPEHWPSLKIVSWQDSAIARYERTWRDVRVYAPLPAARPAQGRRKPGPEGEKEADKLILRELLPQIGRGRLYKSRNDAVMRNIHRFGGATGEKKSKATRAARWWAEVAAEAADAQKARN
jgi:hypothetical protein